MLRRVRVTIVAVEMKLALHILMCVCSLCSPACIAHAPYYIVVCGLPGYTIFSPHYLINGTTFEKKVIEHKMCVLISSTTFV